MGLEETREAIIRESVRLFADRGYDRTTVQAIIDAVGVSKGAFYHHFSSKEDIVEAITHGYISEGLESLEKAASDKGLSAVEKLNRLIEVSQLFRSQRQDTREAIERSFSDNSNLKLEKAIIETLRKHTVPLFAEILEEGITSGEFPIENAGEHAAILFRILLGMKETLRERMHAGADPGTIEDVLRVHENAVCRVLRIPEGSLELALPYMSRIQEEQK